MSQANAQNLLQLLNVIYRTNDNEERTAATIQINQLLKIPGSLFDLIFILQQCTDDTFRKAALILIRQTINDLISSYAPEQIQQIKEMLLSILQNEPDLQFRISLCEVIKSFHWDDIYEFANQMLQDENLFTTGLYLWSLIFSNLPSDVKIQVAPFLIDSCQRALTIDLIESRVYGTSLLQTIFWETNSKIDYTQIAESFVPLLLQVLRKVFLEDQNVLEANSLVNNISEIISVPSSESVPEVFEQFVIQFSQLSIEIMSQESLPLELRLKAYGLIDNENSKCCSKLLDQDFEIIQNYFTLFINMMVQFLQIQRDESTFDFASKFFHNAGATIEGNAVFIYIYKVSSQLAASLGPIGIQAGLFLLYSIVEPQQEYFSEYIDLVIKYIVTYADCNDDYLLIYAFRLISELAEYAATALTSKIDLIIDFLMKHLAHPEGINTLDYVLDQSLHPPSNLLEFIQTLINFCQLANPEQAEMIISCIASSISSSFQPYEEVYGIVCPILNQALLLNSKEMHTAAIRCFGNLSIIAPKSSSTEIEKLSAILMQTLTATAGNNDLLLLSETLICLRKVCQNLPISLSPFFVSFAQICISLITEVYPIKQGEKDSENLPDEIYSIQEELLLCIATFISAYPQKMAPFAETFYQLLLLVQKNDRMTIPFCKSLKIAARGLKAIGMNCFPIFNPVLNQLKNSDNIDMMVEIHNTLTSLIICCRDQISPQVAQTISQHLTNGIGGQYLPGYLMYILSASIHIRLIPPAFKCLIQFIDAMGPNIKPFADDIDKAVEQYLNHPCKSVCGLATEIYAKLGTSMNDGEDLCKNAIDFVSENMELKRFDSIVQESIARSLRYILNYNTKLFSDNPQLFIDYFQLSENFLKLIFIEQIDSQGLKYSFISYWCTLIITLQLTPSVEILAMVISALPPPPSDESVPSIAHFALFAMKNFPSTELQEKLPFIAASVISSEDSIILKVQQDAIGEILQIISAVPEENLIQLVFFNEGTLLRLMANLTKLIALTTANNNENSGN